MSRIETFTRLLARRKLPLRHLSGVRAKSHAAHAFARDASGDAGPSTPSPRSLFSDVPLNLGRSGKGKERERVSYRPETAGVSTEQRAYFAGEDEGGLPGWGDGTDEASLAGLEPGRVVECRRSGTFSIGLLLASVMSNGRARLILLRQSGEIWPIAPKDVQFVMPQSLIPRGLYERCWSPDLLEAWAKGDVGAAPEEAADGDMMAARREAVVIIRKVGRETERMVNRLSGSGGGGVDAVWVKRTEGLSEEERGRITAAEAADILLSTDGPEGRRTKPNTLPAYAAHRMLIARSDLFVADDGEMWDTGVFLVRSRAERARFQAVTTWVDGATPEDAAVLQAFVDKARAALAQMPNQTSPVEWSETARAIISMLFLRLFETRTTQHSPSDRLSVAILRALDPYSGAIADQRCIAHLLTDLGCLPPSDSLETSKAIETESRSISLAGLSLPTRVGGDDLFNGTELDSLREDFSSHTVWVIDDITAQELDDGISISRIEGSEDVWVHVHIADPTRIIPLDHPLAVRASFRGTALYLPEGNVPLIDLPGAKGLSLGSAGDGEEEGRAVMTFSARLGADGQIKESLVRPGWIKKPRLTTYADVDAAFGVPTSTPVRPFGLVTSIEEASPARRDPINPAEIPQLDLLRSTAVARRAQRLRSSGLDFGASLASSRLLTRSPPYHNIFTPSSLPSLSTPFPSAPLIDYTLPASPPYTAISAAAAVAEMMMLAGRVAASYCMIHGVAVPYRGAVAPSELHIPGRPEASMSIEELLAHRKPDASIDPFIVWKSRVAFAPSTVTTDPRPHWNMGFVGDELGYTRATSPLRRYDDLLVHWQLKSHLAMRAGIDWGRVLDEGEMGVLAKRVKGAQLRGRRAGIASEAFWQAGVFAGQLAKPRYAEKEGEVDLREPVTGRVAGPSIGMRGKMSTPVRVEGLGVVARLLSEAREFEVGEEVQVRIEMAVQWPRPIVGAVLA